MELTTVTDREAVLHDGTSVFRLDNLDPSAEYQHGSVSFQTLPRLGSRLCTFATVNDVHFGETVCGYIKGDPIGPVFRSVPPQPPYPEVMNRGAVAEISAIAPEVVVAKGDLTSGGEIPEYERFMAVYGGSFGGRLLHVRGNHDAYHGAEFAAEPMQSRELRGATILLLDTARPGFSNGTLSQQQVDWLDAQGQSATNPVLVFGHHHIWNPQVDPRSDTFFGLLPQASEALLAVFARHPSLHGYFAGHTHRNRCQRIEQAPNAVFVEVSSVKDFPGSWAEYRVCEQGILQVHHRISTPDALAWSEKTRGMYAGTYGHYAFGRIEDRCFVIDGTPERQ